ncbi:hypothetical protein X771_17530 [Mesorhizobium sp. LSJC277A00]|nr:hypothetical protein X771_17530 [Mesorhizobium sp. LSJC277A00]ESX94484.1 hypothetical protein X754_13670 [Mesorhizobium sp. LNJC403B00]ESY22418.1 hypothetical protein X751_07920 [Mesorhizobium sp. LNJC395A00]ESY50668.1 hypothetical protein X746_00280 [Mesorhizobium sp. LNJC380A00]ESZ42969.1 hypothetical protein X732_03895 [Mesorhizobium sp. L2C066B000]ESZ45354.1 hypothetical protein X731_19825 [Mesorhizobium sp. L2C054A000]
MINRSSMRTRYLEVGSRDPDDVITCSDIDMISLVGWWFLHKAWDAVSGAGVRGYSESLIFGFVAVGR